MILANHFIRVYITQYMKHVSLLTLLAVLCSCSQIPLLIVINETDETLKAQSIVVKRSKLNILAESYFRLIANETELPSQYDDTDGDGQWDGMAFQVDLEPNQVMTIELNPVDGPVSYPMKTGIHLGYSPERNNQFTSVDENTMPAEHVAQSTPFLYQFEGPGWESNLVGFRTYFDSRNGKDIFGKTTEEITLPGVGTGENYHELQAWGMDVLKVGNSLGAGALALKSGDSLIRLSEVGEQAFNVVFEGPVRSRTELTYTDWKAGSKTIQLKETIEIWANKMYYQSTIAVDSEGDTLATGIVNLHDMKSKELSSAGHQLIYTHGVQSENKDVLGMALILPEAEFAGSQSIAKKDKGIGSTEVAFLNSTDGTTSFVFVAGWELTDETMNSQASFKDYLIQTASELNSPISIKYPEK